MDIFFIILAISATLFFIVVSIISATRAKRNRYERIGNCRYTPQNHLMTGTKKHCFQLFNELFGQTFYIIPDVKISSILKHKLSGQSYASAKSYLSDRNIDFVFCNKTTLRPICAIKLDLPSEHTSSLDINDIKLIFKKAHFPCLIIKHPHNLTAKRAIEEISHAVYEASQS